ncbi:hypothetical protein J3R30DRAFT_3432016 [Lentinula aciculospora]|uniref:Uncharacterized protein n=1 Tax=Lentinula aciculospora TaxID=153920 RepID=A0A9W9DVG4_9AGAR|nr:hypothetical protein J3R30DRAFT_3432016 [Lentinula aciculospora]
MGTYFIFPTFPPLFLFAIFWILLHLSVSFYILPYPSTSFYHPLDLSITFHIFLSVSCTVAYSSRHSYI